MSQWGEKRTYQRVGFLCRVGLTTDEGVKFEASTVDISLGGTGIISPRLVASGRTVTIAFHLRDKAGAPAVESVTGRVAHVRSDLDGHALGIEFLESLRRERNPLLTRAIERL